MHTLDTVFLIITAVSISLFFVISTTVAIYIWMAARRIMRKAEAAIDSVESVTQMVKDVGKSGAGKGISKLIKYLIRMNKENRHG